MANWRDDILKHFKPKISRLTLVADPDWLLTEEGMLSAIRERGFELIPFDDPIAFRFAYESQYRSRWDQGQNTDLVVVLRSGEQQLNKLPYDLLKAGRPLTFALHQLFPKLNYPVIAGLDRLSSEGFAVYLTADHGNVGAKGIGNPREGVLAETKGKRPGKSPVSILEYVGRRFREPVGTPYIYQRGPGSAWPGKSCRSMMSA